MSGNIEFHPGAMIRCPGCGVEVHASENTGHPERPFSCNRCKDRALDRIKNLTEMHERNVEYGKSEGKSDGDGADHADAISGTPRRGRSPKPESSI